MNVMESGHFVIDVFLVAAMVLSFIVCLTGRRRKRSIDLSGVKDVLSDYRKLADDQRRIEGKLRELMTLIGAIEDQPKIQPLDYAEEQSNQDAA